MHLMNTDGVLKQQDKLEHENKILKNILKAIVHSAPEQVYLISDIDMEITDTNSIELEIEPDDQNHRIMLKIRKQR